MCNLTELIILLRKVLLLFVTAKILIAAEILARLRQQYGKEKKNTFADTVWTNMRQSGCSKTKLIFFLPYRSFEKKKTAKYINVL